jgi:hypothetical protein
VNPTGGLVVGRYTTTSMAVLQSNKKGENNYGKGKGYFVTTLRRFYSPNIEGLRVCLSSKHSKIIRL